MSGKCERFAVSELRRECKLCCIAEVRVATVTPRSTKRPQTVQSTNRMLCGSEQEEQELLRTVMDAEGKETGRQKPVVVWAGVVEVVARVGSASTTAVAYCQLDGRVLHASLLLYVGSDRRRSDRHSPLPQM